jgi:hypothetical protein
VRFFRGEVSISLGASRAQRGLEAMTFVEKPRIDATLSSSWSHTSASTSAFSTWTLTGSRGEPSSEK